MHVDKATVIRIDDGMPCAKLNIRLFSMSGKWRAGSARGFSVTIASHAIRSSRRSVRTISFVSFFLWQERVGEPMCKPVKPKKFIIIPKLHAREVGPTHARPK